jgi:hypothetical protein
MTHLSIKVNVTDANTCNESVRKAFKTFGGIRDTQLCAGLPLFIVPKSCEVGHFQLFIGNNF